MAEELQFEVAFASSSERSNDSDFVTRDLERGDGWMSTRNCSYPQQLILEVEQDANLTKIQVSAHHRCIPRKIDFGYCRESSIKVKDPRDLRFDPIGSVEFTKDARYDETKTLFLDVTGSFIQIRLKENYSSRDNKYNQVGIVSLILWGYRNQSKKKDKGIDLSGRQSGMPPRRSLSLDFNTDSQPTPSNIREPVVFSKDPLEDIRAVQKMLADRKKESIMLGRNYEARMSSTAVDLLYDAEQELQDVYQEKRRAQALNNRRLMEMCDIRAKKIHDEVLASIDMDKLLGRRLPPIARQAEDFNNGDRLGLKSRLQTRSSSRSKPRRPPQRTFTAKARERLEMQPSRRTPSPKRRSSGDRRRSRSDSRDKRRRSRSDSRDRRKRRSRSDSRERNKRRPDSKDWQRSPTPENRRENSPPPTDPDPTPVAAASVIPAEPPVMQMESTDPQKCPFCSEINSLFLTKAKLNKHFAEGCPVLARCPQCTRAIEVWKLNDHFLNRCPMKENFKLHEPCGVGIQTSSESEHGAKCPQRAPSGDNSWCPLCFQEVTLPTFRNSWRKHLTGPNATCTGNERKHLHGVPRKAKPAEAAAVAAPAPDMLAALKIAEGGSKKKKKKKKKSKKE